MVLAGCMVLSGAGCDRELPPSLGNIDSSRETDSKDSKNAPPTTLPVRSSEWAIIREASKPHWSRDEAPEEASAPDNEEPARDDATESGDESGGGGETDPSSGAQTGSPDKPLIVVDRHHELPPKYEPDDLKFLHPLDIPTLGGGSMKLREQAARATSEMVAAAREDDIELLVSSAYRSYDTQVVSYQRLVSIYGDRAKSFSAPPGHSEHQLGTAIDLSNSETDYRLIQRFGETEASAWLGRNAASYGFVLSYPPESEQHTGYDWEPWHYRYVGEENARSYEEGDYASPQEFFLERGVIPENVEK